MAWASYSQNFEDVMLMRALRDVSRGFYIDVGAQGPVDGSVTKAFYDRGWRGINIEPSVDYYEKLVAERPRDINLCIFIGANAGVREFYEIPGTGLSTGIADIAKLHANAILKTRKVEQLSLDEVCAKHVNSDVHFLKIDAEGAEAEVISGFSFA